MAGYTKLFASLVHSTIWRESDHVRLVWITMLALADRDGLVEASVPGLADAARVTREQCDDALARLAAPDPDSRSKSMEGRRIIEIDGGWSLVTYAEHRDRLTADKRRDQARVRMQKKRARDGAALRVVRDGYAVRTPDPAPDPTPTPDPEIERPARPLGDLGVCASWWARGITEGQGGPCTSPGHSGDLQTLVKVCASHAPTLSGTTLHRWVYEQAMEYARTTDGRYWRRNVRRWGEWLDSGRPVEAKSGRHVQPERWVDDFPQGETTEAKRG
jgi:hypothetical protein